MSYTCYKLDTDSRKQLMQLFPPKYPAIRYDHITIAMFDGKAQKPEPAQSVEIVGIANDGNGIEAFIAKVNGSIRRPDGSIWHITASFDPEKTAPAIFDISSAVKKTYRAATSNGFLKQLIDENNQLKSNIDPLWSVHLLKTPIPIKTKPLVQLTGAELKNVTYQNQIH